MRISAPSCACSTPCFRSGRGRSSMRIRSTATRACGLSRIAGRGGACGRGKRPWMVAVASAGADRVIGTDDKPRTEDPAPIRAAILAEAARAAEIADRREAIRTAIAELKPGDVLLIAGKGHETGQIVGERVLPFTDHEAVSAALQEKVA